MNIYQRLFLTVTAGIAFCVCAGSASATQISNLREEDKIPDTDRGVHTALDRLKVDDLSFTTDAFDENSGIAGPIGLKKNARPFVQPNGKDVPALERARVPMGRDSKSPVARAVPDRGTTGLLLLPAFAGLLIVKIMHRRLSRNS